MTYAQVASSYSSGDVATASKEASRTVSNSSEQFKLSGESGCALRRTLHMVAASGVLTR